MIEKIISGGQTGADQGGLEAGKELGIRTGGTAPFGWKTEEGSNYELRDTYNLKPSLSSNYQPRTKANVRASDGTVIFGNINSPGSKLTLRLCDELDKTCLHIVNPEAINHYKPHFITWLHSNNIKVLNVAGNRESKHPGIQIHVKNFLVEAIKEYNNGQ